MISQDDTNLIEFIGLKNLHHDINQGEFNFIANTDGSIRWIYPKKSVYPSFLNFYATSSVKAKFISFSIRILFYLKLKRFIKSGQLDIVLVKEGLLFEILKNNKHDCYSIFTGTKGENRKVIIELNKNMETFMFVKIALSKAAIKLLNNEAQTIRFLNSFKHSNLIIPELLGEDKQGVIGLSNIKPSAFKQFTTINSLHIIALSELYSTNNEKLKWEELPSLKESKNNLLNLLYTLKTENELDILRIHTLATKLLYLSYVLEEKKENLTVSIAHGDFTPWNMYLAKDKLHLFDWELSQNKIPLFFDIYHFVFQSSIMVRHENYKTIISYLDILHRSKDILEIIDKYEVNLYNNYSFYLIQNISYYLSKYIKQKDLHEQVFWMINVWEEAVSDLLNKEGLLFNEK